MRRGWLGADRIDLEDIDSTSEELWRRTAKGAVHGTVLTARFQTAGRGRQGRSWDAVRGNLLVSWVIRTPQTPSMPGALSIVQGLALCRALDAFAPGRIRLKWPNDILLDGLKLGGLLLEARSVGDFCVVSGFGLNLVRPEQGWGALEGRAIALDEIGIQISAATLLEELLDALEFEVDRYLKDGPAAAFAQWEDWSALDGRSIEWEDAGVLVTGTVHGLAPDGGLRVVDSMDGERLLYAADVHLRESR